MSKKKKKSVNKKNKSIKPLEKKTSGFYLYALATVLILVAIISLIGGFNTGGSLPIAIFHGFYWLFGWGAFFSMIGLVVLAIIIFRNDQKVFPIYPALSLLVANLSISAVMEVLFANKSVSGSWLGGHGGHLGSLVGNSLLSSFDKFPAFLIFLVIFLIAFSYSLNITIKDIASFIIKLFKRSLSETAEQDLASVAKNQQDVGDFKLNEGVPIERSAIEDKSDSLNLKPMKITNLRNSASPLTKQENHDALTTETDLNWQYPAVNLLNQKQEKADPGNVKEKAQLIHDTLANFNIEVQMEGANIGPRVTQYSLRPPSSTKLTKITALESNLALDLAAHSIRIEAPIPGKRAVGIEVPNIKPAIVRLSSILTSTEWATLDSGLGFVIGKDIAGKAVVADLGKMPHLLIAGQTGAGKSVMINTLINSLLYRNSPADLKLILVDPKQVELTLYNDIPHLLTPVINEPEKCISALKWAVAEMERRLKLMSEVGKRDIGGFNQLKDQANMPYIVIVIDELADLMMMAARDVESLIVRLAQKSRAAGIHLVIATQRPSVDVITGLIKANVPARIAFTVASQVDSRTIIDQVGAEKLLGKGDMLLLTSDMPKPKRIQAAFIDENETDRVVSFIKNQQPPQYNDEVVSQPVQISGKKGSIVSEYGAAGGDYDDDLWKDAVSVVLENKKASTSLLQRRLRIGYGRAARLIEGMEEKGIIGPADGSRPREVLVSSISEALDEPSAASLAELSLDDDAKDEYLSS